MVSTNSSSVVRPITNRRRIYRQRGFLTVAFILLLIIVVASVAFRFWLSSVNVSVDRTLLFDNIFFVVLSVLTIVMSVVGYVIYRLYTSLKLSTERVALEHAAALRQEQEKIRIKRQLTNNVNHEIKTPICSILGYLEMILGDEKLPEDRLRSFVRKSYDQAERLRSLMADLSTITRIEDASMMIDTELVDLVSLVDTIVGDTLPQAQHSGISVVNRVLGSDVVVEGNRTLLYSIFRNLIDNAIAYSGGRHLFIDLTGNDAVECRFLLQDNGIGVEERHFPYLFERFYRVDTGRSRKAGGTGLGLSIVKNAVLFHGGVIDVRRSRSGGVEFEFSLLKSHSRCAVIDDMADLE